MSSSSHLSSDQSERSAALSGAEVRAASLGTEDIQITADGSLTLRSRRFGQTYGSVHGAHVQAQQVFVDGAEAASSPRLRVLELGFGVGQNLRATLAARSGRPLEYLAYEYDPVRVEVLAALARPADAVDQEEAVSPGADDPLWHALLTQWPPHPTAPIEIGTAERWLRVHCADVLGVTFVPAWADAIYLDGFSPDANPELWSPEFLARAAQALRPGGVLVTYSAAGRVRRALQSAGLEVERRPGPPGKREVLRAVRP